MEGFSGGETSLLDLLSPVRLKEDLHDRRRIDDNHWASLSSRTACDGGTRGFTGILLRSRSRSSDRVGRSARRVISAIR